MLHLYRIYNLHPVIHENLRPEKPPKPFPRACLDEDGLTIAPRRRKTKKGNAGDNDGVAGAWSILLFMPNHSCDDLSRCGGIWACRRGRENIRILTGHSLGGES